MEIDETLAGRACRDASRGGVTRRGLFRLAAESRLIDDVEKWMEFHQARNLSSHTYSAVMADEVLKYALQFERFARELLGRFEERNE